MDELEELRRRKIAAMQSQKNTSEQDAVRAQLQQLERIAREHLDGRALERYTNIKIAHPEKAIQVLALVAQMVKQGHARISDESLKRMLTLMQQQKRDIKIRRV